MISQPWVIILSVCFFITTMCFLVAIIALVYASIEIRKASVALKEFLKTTEENLKPIIGEAGDTIRAIGEVSADVQVITGNVREFSAAVGELGLNIRAVNTLITSAQEGLSLRALGLRAGVRAALDVLTKRSKEGRS